MKRIFVSIVLATGIIACSKDKFKTEPQVDIKSFGPAEVTKGELFTLRAEVTDKEGDVQDSVLLVRKRYNAGVALPADTLRYSIKDFHAPIKSKIEISAEFSYGELRDNYIFENPESKDTEITIGIIVRDKAGHRSNYDESDKILLKKV
jgi:hypothetical protein